MPYPYQVWLRQPCLDYLGTLKVTERKRLLAWLEALGSGFTREGDFTIRGTDDRDWQVAILGLHAAVWWVDHAAREVKVVALRPADC